MRTINAATMYADLMQAAAIAPTAQERGAYIDQESRARILPNSHYIGTGPNINEDESGAMAHHYLNCQISRQAYSGLMECIGWMETHVKIKTQHGYIKLVNTKERLTEFAARDVAKCQKIWGGGIAKEVKAKQATQWKPGAVKAVFEAIQDGDFEGAFLLAQEKCDALFFIGDAGARMVWAPQNVEGMPDGFVSVRTESGRFDVIHTADGTGFNSFSTRANAEEVARYQWEQMNQDAAARHIEATRQDQTAARAQWLAERGIIDDAAIEARIDAKAAQDVLNVLAAATAGAAIEQAAQQAPERADAVMVDDARELVAVDCCDMAQAAARAVCELGSAGGASGGGSGGGFAGSVRYTIAAPMLALGGAWQLPANFGRGAGGLYAGGNYAQAPASADPAFNPEDIEPMRLTMPEVRAWSAAQFDAVYEHLEDVNYHTECVLISALRYGSKSMIKEARSMVRQQLAGDAMGKCQYAEFFAARRELSAKIDAMRDAAQAVDKPASLAHRQARQASADGASGGVSVPVHKASGEDMAAVSSGQFKTLTASAAADLQMHGKDWDGRDLTGWYWSEKLDGCRAYWDGVNLYTKSGNLIDAPHIMATLPAGFALDGEIYAGHGNYETARLFTQYGKNPEAVRFVAFDAPGVAGDWIVRIRAAELTGVECVTAARIDSMERARFLLGLVIEDGGEGVMVRKPRIEYTPGRSCNTLKLKAPSMALFYAIAQQAAQADDGDIGIYDS